MAIPNLTPDDLPPQRLELDDYILRRYLDLTLSDRFLHRCDQAIGQLLGTCNWEITTSANVATLVIVCPDRKTNWRVLNRVLALGHGMAQFSQDAKLRIYATPEKMDCFEIRVDELPIYEESD